MKLKISLPFFYDITLNLKYLQSKNLILKLNERVWYSKFINKNCLKVKIKSQIYLIFECVGLKIF